MATGFLEYVFFNENKLSTLEIIIIALASSPRIAANLCKLFLIASKLLATGTVTIFNPNSRITSTTYFLLYSPANTKSGFNKYISSAIP